MSHDQSDCTDRGTTKIPILQRKTLVLDNF